MDTDGVHWLNIATNILRQLYINLEMICYTQKRYTRAVMYHFVFNFFAGLLNENGLFTS